VTTRDVAVALDSADGLAPLREQFEIEPGPSIYIDGNSLGRLSRPGRAAIEALVDEWSSSLIAGWDRWIGLPQAVGDELASRFLGARPGEVLACDSTTVNLYKLIAAAVADRPGRDIVVTDRGNFPTDRYLLEGLAQGSGVDVRFYDADPVEGPDVASLAPALRDDVAAVVISHVDFRSGALADMAALTALVHDAGAHCIWDLSHAIGSVPVDRAGTGAALAAGCTYKYLNGGPGAPAFLYVRADLQERLRSPIWGWFGRRDQFGMAAGYEPAEGVTRFLTGTPDIMGLASLHGAISVFPPMAEVRAKSEALTAMAVDLHDRWLVPLGFELATPRYPARRGGHVSVRHPDAWRICRALIETADVIPDFRAPDSIRFGLAPLYTRYVDVWDALDRLRAMVEAGEHEQVDDRARPVT
jgi:kynureninase